MNWQPIETAPRGAGVETKFDGDGRGERNVTTLKRGRDNELWWTPDGAMYVYYQPTHWRPTEPPAEPPDATASR
jgi:hypothetical protein